MPKLLSAAPLLILLSCSTSPLLNAQASDTRIQTISMPQYSATIEAGSPPQIKIAHEHEIVFQSPLVSGLAAPSSQEVLTDIQYALKPVAGSGYIVDVVAKSSLWTQRRFAWRLFPDHIEFQQFANGKGKLGRCYFFSNGISNRWDNGTSPGHDWNTTIYADRYFSPSPNHANQSAFAIAMPQTLGFSNGRNEGSDEDFRPERITGLFAPPPLFLAFHLNGGWTSIAIGAKPGEYLFPAFEYSGSRYAGASFYVNYMGYRAMDGEFESPVLAVHFGYDPLDMLGAYTAWLDRNGFSTERPFKDVRWHHLPIFCGWAEQTTESVPLGGSPNKLATQVNYEKWIAVVEERHLPVGTIVIDDKWQQGYGSFEVDQQKWPDMKGFIAAQHAKGRHVLLWVPVAHIDGLPKAFCARDEQRCPMADVGNPEYEAYLRSRIQHLVNDLGVDGFKEDRVQAPTTSDLALTGPTSGIEYVRRFQYILYSEAHKWKPDAMIETQTTNALFQESSDVLRLNDIWYSSRNVPEMMRLRAHIANVSGWPVVDTDNASSTTLKDWWEYMQAQPTIGIPALYFVTRTEATQESPSEADWRYLAAVWTEYIRSLDAAFPQASR
jgi:hypothetical protein